MLGDELIFDVPDTGVDWPATEEAQIGSFESGWGFGAFSKSYRQEEICELLEAAGFVDIRFDTIVHDGDKRGLLVVARRGDGAGDETTNAPCQRNSGGSSAADNRQQIAATAVSITANSSDFKLN